MAVKTYRVGTAAQVDGNFAALFEADQTAASRTDGWTVAKLAATNQSDFDVGVKQASGTFAVSAKPASFLTGTNANAFKTPQPLTGNFAATAWTFTFAVRAGVASAQAGRMRMRVFKSKNADGSSATEITGATQVGTTSAALSTTVDQTTVVTWSPGAISLSLEFLFFVIAWEITTASGSNSGDVLIRTGQSAAGSRCVTPDFTDTTPVFPAGAAVVDNFNRANGALAAPWFGQIRTGGDGLQVVGNQLKMLVSTAWDGAGWDAPDVADMDVAITVVTNTPASHVQLHVRRQRGADTSYYVDIFQASPTQLAIWKRVAGGDTQLGAIDSSQTFVNGDSLGIRIIGSGIYVYRKTGGTWQFVTARSDTQITAPGFAALYANDPISPSVVLDDWIAPVAQIIKPIVPAQISAASTVGGSITSLPPSKYATEVKADSPAAYWRMDQVAIPILDISGNSRHLTSDTRTSQTTGLLPNESASSGRAFVAAGGGSFLSIGGLQFPSNTVSIEMFVKRTVFGGNQDLCSEYNGGPGLRIASDGTLVLLRSFAGIVSSSTNLKITDSLAHHIVVTRNGIGGVVTFYLDGASEIGTVGAQYSGDFTSASNTGFFVGSEWGNQAFDGTLDEVAVYQTVLPASRVQAHYAASKPFPLIDDFNRADGAAWNGAGSSIWASAGVITTQGNKLTASAASGSRTKFLFDSDFDVQIDVVVSATGFGFICCIDDPAGKQIMIDYDTTFSQWSATGYPGSVPLSGSWIASPPTAGETYWLKKSGNNFSFYKKSGTGSFSLIGSFTAAGWGAGTFGFWIPDTNIRLDNFCGGPYTYPLVAVPIAPGQISANSTLSGSLGVTRRVTPTQIAANSTVSGAVRVTRRIAPTQISATSTVSGSTRAIRRVAPAQITATSSMSGSVRVLRRVAPTVITATSSVSGSIIKFVPPKFIIAAQISAFSTVNGNVTEIERVAPAQITATSSMSGTVRVTRRVEPTVISASTTVSGNITRIGAVRPITPGAVSAISTVSGSIVKVVAPKIITPGQISATASVSGAIRVTRRIAPGQITASSTVSGAVRALRKVLPAAIGAVSSLSGALRVVRGVLPAQIAATASVSGSLRVARRVAPTQISATSTVGGSIRVTRKVVPAQITATSTASGSVIAVGISTKPIFPGQVNATSTVAGVVRFFKRVAPAQITATSTVSSSVTVRRRVAPAQVAATSTVSSAIRVRRAIRPVVISATATVNGSIRAIRRITPAEISATSTLSAAIIRYVPTTVLNTADAVYLGGQKVDRVYAGTNLVWSR